MSTATAKFNDKTWVQWTGLILRVVIGGLFIYAGLPKLTNLDAFRRSLMAYQIFPTSIVGTIAIIVPILEVALGLLLVLGLFTRIAALGVTFLLVVYIAGIISVWARHISIDCGCFSKGGIVAVWPEAVKGYKKDILRDTLMALAGVWLFLWPVTKYSVDRWLKGPKITDFDDYDEIDDVDDAAAESTN